MFFFYFCHPSHNFTDITLEGAKRGITLELCAGLVDKKGKSLATIATEEGNYNFLISMYYVQQKKIVILFLFIVLEECGFALSQPIECE